MGEADLLVVESSASGTPIPAPVTINPPAAGADEGKATFTVIFSKPGEYVLRARATDTAASTTQDLKVTVQ